MDEERLEQVATLMALGTPESTVERACAAEWDCSRDEVREYIAAAKTMWLASAPSTHEAREERRARIRAGLEAVANAAAREGDASTQLRALSELISLDGLRTPDDEVRESREHVRRRCEADVRAGAECWCGSGHLPPRSAPR